MKYKDYYKILGVAKNAQEKDIHRAYRKLARKYHPDISKESDADEKFREINEAKEVLKDPEKRKLYDRYGQDWEQAGQQPPSDWNSGANRASNEYKSYQNFNRGETFQGAEGFSEFFSSLFGDRATDGYERGEYKNFFTAAGRSREAEIEVQLSEVFSELTRIITFQVFEANIDGRVTPKEKKLQVKIPKGVTNGSIIRLSGQGEKGVGGGKDGDLLLRVSILPDQRFYVDGHNLHTSVSVSPWEAALGAKIPIKTVNGKVNLSLPPGSQSGQQFRLKGLGIPIKGASPGDIIIEIDIQIPKTLTDKEKQLFEELLNTSKFDPREEKKQRATHYEKI